LLVRSDWAEIELIDNACDPYTPTVSVVRLP
jgi:hypothetical protein